ncbi:MAG: hypothetical protein ABIR78_03555 [Ferruginibacter sp.]
MKAVFLSFMLLSALWIHAQNSGSDQKFKESFTNLKLQKYPIANFPDNSMPVSDIKIVQFLNDSIRMGYTYKGENAYVTTIRVAKPLTAFLQELIYRMYKHDFKKTGIKMLWVLKDFRLAQKAGEKISYRYTKLQADAYVSREGALYNKAFTIDTVILSSFGFDYASLYSSDFESIFSILSKRTLLVADSVFARSFNPITIDQIIKSNELDEMPPILKDNFYIDGIYTDFNQFLQNRPTIEKYSLLEIPKNSLKFIDSISNVEVDSTKIWGICKKGVIYKYDDGSLIPIERQGRGFIISDFVASTNKYNAIISANIKSRQMPVVYFAPISSFAINPSIFLRKRKYNEPLLMKEVPGIIEKSMLPLAFGINMRTGIFSF